MLKPDILTALAKAFQCLFKGLTNLNSVAALAIIVEVIKIVFPQAPSFSGNLSTFCIVNPSATCVSIIPTSAVCGQAIPVTLPGNLNLGPCFNLGSLVCPAGSHVTDTLVANFIKTLQERNKCNLPYGFTSEVFFWL
ncbi:hypothetical protein V5799_005256 [Amblyomma americanum]|uniref:Uncharacterized protein n=1 Tax=Amblyomma americanum TaxID=6943 RepID=A0AAQ4DZS3_AMBAM